MTGEAPVIPDGYAAYGWHHYGSWNGLWYGSRVHLVPVEQVATVRGGTIERAYGPAVCGRRMRGLGRKPDEPVTVVWDMERGERQPCERCFKKASFKKASPDDA